MSLEEILPSVIYTRVVNHTERCIFVQAINVLDDNGLPVYEPATLSFFLFYFAFSLSIITVCMVYVVYVSYIQRAYKGELLFLFIIYLGICMQLVVGPLREGVGRVNFPNDVVLFCIHGALVSIALGTFFHLRLAKQKMKLFSELRVIVFGEASVLSESNGAMLEVQAISHGPGSSANIESESYESRDESFSTSDMYSTNVLDKKQQIMDATFEHDMKRRTSLLIAIPLIIVAQAIAVLIIWLDDTQGKFFTGCYGGYDSLVVFLVALSVEIACSTLFGITLYLDRNTPDPLEFKSQLPFLLFGAMLAGVGNITYDFARNDLTFSIGTFILSFGLTLGFYGISVRAIVVSKFQQRRVVKDDDKFEYDKFLNDPVPRAFFEMFLVSELSIESLMFYTEGKRWEKYTRKNKNSTMAAMHIFDTYLDRSSPFQVNISEAMVREISRKIRDSRESEEPMPKNTFSEAIMAVRELLIDDSFPRFFNSDIFRKYEADFANTV